MKQKQTLKQVLEEIGLIDEWRTEGKHEGLIKAAQNLKRLEVPLNQIAEGLELSMEEVIQV